MAGSETYGFVTSLLLWFFVPKFITKFIIGQYYGFRFKSATQRPKEGSPTYQSHYQLIYSLVIVGYFMYCMVDFWKNVKPSYYEIIGVDRQKVDSTLKTHFRHMIVNLHPDKNPDADREKFMQIKQIYEVLSSETSRIAYDCYGPEVLRTVSMTSAKSSSGYPTLGDYFLQATIDWAGFYVVTAAFFLLATVMGNRNGLFWRSLGLVGMATVDLYVLMRPLKYGMVSSSVFDDKPILGLVLCWWKRIPIFEKLAFARQAYMYLGMAFGQVTSLQKGSSYESRIKELTQRLELVCKTSLNKESDYHLQSTIDPVVADPEMLEILRRKVGKIIVELQLFELYNTDEKRRSVNKKTS